MLRLAMQMSLQESDPSQRPPPVSLTYPSGSSSSGAGEDNDPALAAALAASMVDAPQSRPNPHSPQRKTPAAVGWVAGAPPPPAGASSLLRDARLQAQPAPLRL